MSMAPCPLPQISLVTTVLSCCNVPLVLLIVTVCVVEQLFPSVTVNVYVPAETLNKSSEVLPLDQR